jgi:hypothetical protein
VELNNPDQANVQSTITPPMQTPVVAEKPAKSAKINWKFLVAIFAVLLILIGVVVFTLNQKSKVAPKTNVNKTKLITPPSAIDAISKTYTNQKYGYSVIYPATLKTNLNEINSGYVEFFKSLPTPIYTIRVEPESVKFNPLLIGVGIDGFKDVQYGTSTATFTRLPDKTIDGLTGIVVGEAMQNPKSGYMYVSFRRFNFIYLISMPYGTNQEITDSDSFLSSFKFLQLLYPPDWQQISDPLSTINYPATWSANFNQDTQCEELSDVQNIREVISTTQNHNFIQICVHLGHMSQFPYGSDSKPYSVNGFTGVTSLTPSKVISGLTEHVMIQNKNGNEYAEFINESGDESIFHQIIAAFKFNR